MSRLQARCGSTSGWSRMRRTVQSRICTSQQSRRRCNLASLLSRCRNGDLFCGRLWAREVAEKARAFWLWAALVAFVRSHDCPFEAYTPRSALALGSNRLSLNQATALPAVGLPGSLPATSETPAVATAGDNNARPVCTALHWLEQPRYGSEARSQAASGAAAWSGYCPGASPRPRGRQASRPGRRGHEVRRRGQTGKDGRCADLAHTRIAVRLRLRG